MPRKFFRRACAFVMTLNLLTMQAALAAPITNDANLQYFNYNGKTMALVGTSASYLCHVTQPIHEDSYCTWENRVSFFTDLRDKGLNKIRLWLALNHSPGTPGIAPSHNNLTPFTYEQPFKWDAVNKYWNLDQWEQSFFDRVAQVVSDAQAKGIIVEVTLFDTFSGAFENSPWNDSNNSPQGVNKSLSAEKYFTAYDNLTGDNSLGNQYVRTRQRAFIQKMVTTLNSFDNFYWEISNEPDNANEDQTGTINWHKDMIQEIVNAEAPLAKKHLIAVNFSQDQTVNWAATQANIKIINGHYVTISDFASRPRNGAIEMLRKFLKPTQAGNVDKTFGFNEGRISPNITGADENSVRAEAWEYMLSEGGSFDHLGYEWKLNPATANIRTQLGVLSKFLNGVYVNGVLVTPGMTLTNVSRQIMDPVSWCPDITPYGSGNTYWGAMQWTRNEYALYIHHSTLSTGSFKKYDPIIGSYRGHNFRLNLGTLAGNFTARWIDPKTGLDLATPHNFFWPANGTLYQLPQSPSYNFDIVLSVRRQ